MSTENHDLRQAWDYLLGRLDEEAVDDVDRKYVAEPTYARFLQDAELSLIEAYLDNTLPSADAGLFRSHFLANPKNREQFDLVRAVIENARPRRRGRGVWLAMAAAVVLAAALATQMVEVRTLRSELAAQRRVEPTVSPAATVAELDLRRMVRSAGTSAPVLTLGDQLVLVRFRVSPSGIALRTPISARLMDEDANELTRLPGRLAPDGTATVDCPASVLESGEFVWELSSAGEVAGSYVFRVAK